MAGTSAADGYMRVGYAKLFSLCQRLFVGYGFSKEQSYIITESLLKTDLSGIESHGVQRMIRYHLAIGEGMVNINAQPEIVHETPISAVIDAKDAMGQVVGYDAMRIAIEKAKITGIGMVAVRNSNHYGIAGYYATMAAREDLIGFCMTNSEAIMVPTFGKKAFLGTNPICVAMPADPEPFIFDAATAVVTRGKLEVYNKRSAPIPDGLALDERGLPCTDAGRVIDNINKKNGGGILPLGGYGEETSGYKGFGFGMICELFTAIAAGGPPSHRTYITPGKAETSQCFWAMDYGVFGEKNAIRKNFSEMLEDLRNQPKADGQDRIYIHGEKEIESERRMRIDGVPINEKTYGELKMICETQGLDHAPYIGAEFISE